MKSLIALQNKLSLLSLKCAKDQNYGFIRTYGPNFSFTYEKDLKKRDFVKEIRNHSNPLKLQKNI